MAGRKPKTAAHKVTPLRGRAAKPRQLPQAGYWVDGEWYEPGGPNARDDGFQDGNTASEGRRQAGQESGGYVHGAYSDDEIAPRARALVTSVLEDKAMPDHLRSPAFRHSLDAWGRAEAAASLILEYISGQGIGATIVPKMGGTKAPLEIWQKFETTAARMRSELGISPASYARISRDLGLNQKANEDALERLSGQGAQIVARRMEIEGGSATA